LQNLSNFAQIKLSEFKLYLLRLTTLNNMDNKLLRLKRAILFILLMGVTSMLKANPVDLQTARQAGVTVLEGGDYVAHFDFYTSSDLLYSINSDGQTVTVTGHADGTNATGSLVIPETVMLEYWNGEAYVMGSFTVTGIAASAFENCSGLTGSLILPSTITFIGEKAFMNCTGFFGALNLGESLTTIEEKAFLGCSGFVGTLVIGASMEYIGDYAFKGCSGITALDYNAINCSIGTHWKLTGTGTSSWDSSWLDECSSLTTLHIGNTVEVIPPYAFNRRIEIGFPVHHAISGQLVIPNSVTTIGDGAFSRCLFTGDLVIPNSVTTIGFKAFQYSSFTGNLTLSNSLTTIGDRAFYNCDDFTGHLVIPDSVTSIGEMAFESCSGFTGVTLGNALTTIGRRAFLWCSGLTGSLTIPESVTTIGQSAFSSCPGFTGTLTIGNSVTTIGNNAFFDCNGFTGSLTIPDSVTTIGTGAFSGCSGLTGTLTIGNSVTTIGSAAFKNCSGFTGDLIIPNSVITIDGGNPSGAFQGCSGFSGILVIGSSVTSIITAAFYGCSGFTAIYVRPETPPYIYSTFEYSIRNIPVYVPCGKLSDYQNNSGWNVFTNMIENCTDPVAITATCDPAEGGTLSGTGFYVEGYDCTLTATPNTGYAFSHWTKDGTVVSENATYTFTVAEAAEFVAHFVVSYDITVTCNPAEGGMATGAGTYGYGTTVTLTATANENYSFINWTKNGAEVSTSEAYTFTVTENAAFTANFGFVGYEVTAMANPTEGGTVSGGGSFLPNATCTLSATANEGYTFINWTKDGIEVSTEPSFSFTVTESGSYVANFSLNTYEITATANPGTGGTVSGAGTYGHGTTATLTATANEGYTFINWTKDGAAVSTDTSYSFIVTEVGNYVANFSLNAYEINVTVMPAEGGTATGGGIYDHGSTATLTAIPNTGYIFINWTKEGEEISTSETYSFVVTEGTDYVANFALSYEIAATANPAEGGSISGAGLYAYGTSITLTATPNVGYNFLYWTRDDVMVSNDLAYSFIVTEDAAFVAHFIVSANVDITVTANPTGSGTVNGGGTYLTGSTCTLTAIANADHSFINWMKNGEEVSSEAEYSFIVTEGGDYVANFASDGLHWDFDPEAYPNSMTITGFVMIDSVEQHNPSWEIGAFHGNECRGSARLAEELRTNQGQLYFVLTIYGNEDGDEITFQLYEHIHEQTLDLDCSTSLSFAAGESIGDPNNLLPLNFIDGEVMQTTDFTSGWNWYSTYIEQTDFNGLQILEDGLGTNGVQIKSQQQYVNYYEGMGWMGMLASIDNESTYKIKTAAPCTVEMTGPEANASAHPITIGPGWNWIGYPVNASMSVTMAMSGITPANGDQVKAQNGYVNYYDGMGWMGTLSTIEPGMGILYKSNGSDSFTLVYPTDAKGETLVENITADNNHWVPDMHAYPNNMTVTAVVELDDVELTSNNYELAAFANGECRGSVRLIYIEPIERHLAFLTITGEDVEALSFNLYDTATGMEVYDANEQIIFSNNAIVGDLREPYVLHFRGSTGTDEWTNNILVFPNPVARGENVSLSTTEEIGKVQIEIINAMGVVVDALRATSVQAIAAPNVAGVYTLRITAEGKGSCYRKLVVR